MEFEKKEKAMAPKRADFLATVSLFSHLKQEELQRLANQADIALSNSAM